MQSMSRELAKTIMAAPSTPVLGEWHPVEGPSMGPPLGSASAIGWDAVERLAEGREVEHGVSVTVYHPEGPVTYLIGATATEGRAPRVVS